MILAALALLAVVGGTLLLRRSSDEPRVVFRYSFSPNEQRNYTLDMRVQLAPNSSPQTQPLTGRVKASMTMSQIEKRDDGSTTVELSMRDVKTEPPRPKLPADAGRLRLTIAPDGRILEMDGAGGVFSLAGVDPSSLFGAPQGPSPNDAGTQVLFPQFPSRAIKPGDTWSDRSTITLPFGDEKVNVRTDERFEQYEDSRGGRTARFQVTVTTPLDYTVSAPELRQAVADSDPDDAPTPTTVPLKDAKVDVVGQTVTQARVLLFSKTSELVELAGTTRMSVRMTLSGAPENQGEGGSIYAFDALINLSIVQRDDP